MRAANEVSSVPRSRSRGKGRAARTECAALLHTATLGGVPAGPVPAVGERLREERLRRGVSVRSLARDLGVSASLISQIETGKSQPSVSTLYAMTTALGISVEDVFGPPAVDAGATADGRAPSTVLDALAAARGPRLGPLVAPGERQLLQLDSGVTWERLGRLPHRHVDFLLITYEPGGT